jgi:hypothetical protein
MTDTRICCGWQFVAKNEAEERDYLQRYFGEPPSEYQLARYYLMSQMMHVFYFIFSCGQQ